MRARNQRFHYTLEVSMKQVHRTLLLFIVCLLAPCAFAADEGTGGAGGNLPAQKIGVDDMVVISVYDAPELTRSVRVNPEGQIHLPMMKRAIPAAGLLPLELGAAIAETLRAERILVDPVVGVTVAEYRSRPVRVVGAVKRPVTFQAVGTVTLLDAITRAEGLAPEAGPEILLIRRGPGGKNTTQRIPVKGLLSGADPDLNPRLSGDEEIRVAEAGRIYVAGNVKNPGVFTMKDASDTTVLKALALAGGLVPFAAGQAYIYRRPADGQVKQEILIYLSQIMGRKSPDVALSADDIFYIPDAKGRRLTASAIEKIAGFAGATTSGMLIWRH
jgi:polysaccharide export outer membrane protein